MNAYASELETSFEQIQSYLSAPEERLLNIIRTSSPSPTSLAQALCAALAGQTGAC